MEIGKFLFSCDPCPFMCEDVESLFCRIGSAPLPYLKITCSVAFVFHITSEVYVVDRLLFLAFQSF